MEGRLPPAGDGSHSPPPPLPLQHPPAPLPLPPGRLLQPNQNSLIRPLTPPPGSETYVIQIPKDQIYRVPPAENSKIVETYLQQKQIQRSPSKCCWIFLFMAIIGISVGMIIGILNLIYKPKLPEFKITNFTVTQPPPPNKKHPAKLGYDILFNVVNPNDRMDVSYGENGHGLLSFKQHKIADGKFSSFSQEAKKSNNLHITLKGANVGFPSEMENSIHSTKSKKAISLGFKIFLTAKISSWAKTSINEIAVSCNFKVNTLAKGTRVVDQECSTQVHQ